MTGNDEGRPAQAAPDHNTNYTQGNSTGKVCPGCGEAAPPTWPGEDCPCDWWCAACLFLVAVAR